MLKSTRRFIKIKKKKLNKKKNWVFNLYKNGVWKSGLEFGVFRIFYIKEKTIIVLSQNKNNK